MEKENKDKDKSKESSIEGFKILHNIPPFTFTNLPDTERLTYEMMGKLNFLEIYNMFKADKNPFVIEEYKQMSRLEQYVDSLLNYAKTSTKHGGCDWLVKHKQTGKYLSIINLYELSRETWNNNHKNV